MENEKKNDLLLNMIVNPEFSIQDLVDVGVNASNSTIKDYDSYKNNDLVQNAFKTESGNFDEKKFKQAYDSAVSVYNLMAQNEQEQNFSDYVSFHRDNFFAPIDNRRKGVDAEFTKASNPYQITFGISELGKPGERKKSISELAQAEKVLANPVAVANGAKPIYHDSPNDSFFTDFFDTRVLAQWDEDGEHVDPITGEKVEHKKGDLKLNDNGTFYYENLDGRDIYGRQVLSKMNTLTVDGSKWNKYDFFDSDNLNQNGAGKTILKNAALIGSMFIPYVGPAVAGLSVATQAIGMFGTLGKILTGSDSPTFSAMEGWSKSVNRQLAKSEYSQQPENTWCLENWINLIGDTMGQLKEQRFIFEKVPALFKGIGGASETLQAKKLKQLQDTYQKAAMTKFDDLIQNKTVTNLVAAEKAKTELMAVAAMNAERDMNTFLKGYQSLGSVISKAYMNGITTLDTYGEAKEAGATDFEAAMVAIGYAAQEAAILNTGIGEWILPELRADKFKNKAIVRAITQDAINAGDSAIERSIKKLPNETKKAYINRLFKIGKKIAKAEYSNGTPALKATLAGGLGEGIEEVVEELSADFTRSCYNAVKWLQGDDEHRMDAFGNNMSDRYLMSFFGGAVGGSLTNAFTSYQGMKQVKSMTSDQAMQELVAMCRDKDQIKEFLHTLDKMDFDELQIGNKRLSFNTTTDEDGNVLFLPGDKNNNQTTDIKNAVKKQVELIQNTLEAEGAAISDDSFLDQQALKDLRFYALRNATTAGMYLQQFNTACTNLAKAAENLNNFRNAHTDGKTDSQKSSDSKNPDPLVEEQLTKLQDDFLKAKEKVHEFTEGKHAANYIQDALFEMTSQLSSIFTTPTLPLFAKQLFGKNYNELTVSEKAEANQKFTEWKNGDGKQKIHDMSNLYFTMARGSSDVMKTSTDDYRAMSQDENIFKLRNLIKSLYDVDSEGILDEEGWLEVAQNQVGKKFDHIFNLLTSLNVDPSKLSKLRDLSIEYNRIQEEMQSMDNTDPDYANKRAELNKLDKDFIIEQHNVLAENIEDIIQPYLDQKYIHPEIRNELLRLLDISNRTLENNIAQLYEDLNYGLIEEDELNERERILRPITDAIQNYRNKIKDTYSTPVFDNLKNFALSINARYDDIEKLLSAIDSEIEPQLKNLSQVQLDPTMREAFNNALTTIKMYRAALLGARVDNADIENLQGYNKTLNEVNHKQGTEDWVDLAEIDKDTADLFLHDIDILENKVEFAKKLMDVTEGQKLSEQNKCSVNLHLLNFKGIKTFVQILDDDDDDIKDNVHYQELKDILDNECQILEDLSARDEINQPSIDDQVLIQSTMFKLEDKLYDLFNSISNVELQRIINPIKWNLHQQRDKQHILTINTKDIDPYAFISYLARCCAAKSSNMHKMFLETINNEDNKYAPIPTQEQTIFNQLAFTINGNAYSRFYDAVRNGIVQALSLIHI